LKLGVYLNSQHPESDDPARRLAETIEQVRLIRSLGFDSIWAGEHHVTPGFHFFPQFALLQRAAPEAEGLWIGTNVALLPLHNPVELAEVGVGLSPRGIRHLRRADVGACKPAHGRHRDHTTPVERGSGHPPRPALAVQRSQRRSAPDAIATPAHHRRRTSRSGDQARCKNR